MKFAALLKTFWAKLHKKRVTAQEIHFSEDYEIGKEESYQNFRDALRDDSSTDIILEKTNGLSSNNTLLSFLKAKWSIAACALFLVLSLLLFCRTVAMSEEIESLEAQKGLYESTISQYRSACEELEEKVDDMEDEMQRINSLVSDIDDDLSDIQTDLILDMPYMIYNEISSIESSLSDIECISGQY